MLKLLILALAAGFATPALSQDFGMINMQHAIQNSAILNDFAMQEFVVKPIQQSIVNDGATKRATGSSGSELALAQSNRAVTYTYPANREVSSQARRDFLDRLSRRNPVEARQLAEEFARNDPVRIYSGIVAPFGLRRGDAADSMTAYTLLSWMIANSGADPSRSQVAAARARIAGELSRNPAVRDPANRQRMDEELMYLFVILHAGWQSAQKEGKLDQYSDGVAQTFRKQFGRDLRRLELTNTGFVERG